MLLIELWRHLKTKDPLRRVKGLLKSFASGNSVQNQSRSLLTGLFPLDSGISHRSKITIVRRVHSGGGYFWTKEWITLIFIWLCYYIWQFLWFTVLPNITLQYHKNIQWKLYYGILDFGIKLGFGILLLTTGIFIT